MVLNRQPETLDRDLQPLKVGDHVRFIMRGFFLPREQESFGIIEAIDECGGVKIRPVAGYKQFLSNKRIGDVANHIYFTHHRYDAEKHARVYFVTEGPHELFLSLFECFKETA